MIIELCFRLNIKLLPSVNFKMDCRMSKKRVLIVDDEESILVVLKASLKKLGPGYEIITVMDGFAALSELLKQPFDLIVSDYNMAQMDGLELLEAVRYAQPNTKLILITAFGSDELAAQVKQLQVYRYLTKPLKIDKFRQLVCEALDDGTQNKPKILVLSDERYQQICELLEQLQRHVGGHCTFLTDTTGRLVARTGDMETLPVENMASVLGGGIASLVEAGRMIDGDTDAINLAHREGKQEDLYALNIGNQALLTLIINRGPYSSRLGLVWNHTQKAAIKLRKLLTEIEYTTANELFQDNMNEAIDLALDDLFTE